MGFALAFKLRKGPIMNLPLWEDHCLSHGPERWWMWAVNCFSLNCLLHFVYCALLIKPSWSNLQKKGNWGSIYPRCYDTTAGFDTTVGLWAYILSFSNCVFPVAKLFRLKLCGDMLVINCATGFLHLCGYPISLHIYLCGWIYSWSWCTVMQVQPLHTH